MVVRRALPEWLLEEPFTHMVVRIALSITVLSYAVL